jgi:alkanesulfonate monooxygenase SsuD/methylene tetrahydromethanopterin reductase-like flavin-dependent oxidoreductase (luciferase family)
MVLGYIGGPLSHAQAAVDLYRQAGERAGHPDKLQVGISTHFYAGPDPKTARDVFPYYHEYLRPKTPGGRGFIVNQATFDAGTRRGQAIMIGSAEEITEKILDARELLGTDRFFGQFDWGGMPRDMVETRCTATPPKSRPPSAARPENDSASGLSQLGPAANAGYSDSR